MIKRYSSFKEMISGQNAGNCALRYFEGGEQKRMTYGELLAAMDSYPVPEAATVGVACDFSASSVIAILALAGKRRLVLLNAGDPVETLEAQLRAAKAGALIGEMPEDLEFTPCDSLPDAEPDVLFFTSGTTSSARAVVLDERRLCSSAYNGGYLLPLTENDVFLSVLPHSHVFGFVCTLLWPFSFGAEVCLGRGLKSIFFDFNEFRPTATSLVPEMAGFLAAKRLLNAELKLMLIGAGDCSDAVLSAVKAAGIRVCFGYGLTETSSGIALSLGDDPRAMTICPDYTVSIAPDGEIIVGSETTLMKGYLDDPEATARVTDGKTLYTGDLGVIYDGKLFITGRKKDMIVLSDGTKIFLPEYEAKLKKTIGAECDIAVIRLNNGAIALYAAKVKDIESKVEEFNAELPRNHRISRITYVDSLPKTATGKVQRYRIETGE